MNLARQAIRTFQLSPGLTVISSIFSCPSISPPLQVLYALAMLAGLTQPSRILWVTADNSYDLAALARRPLRHHGLDAMLSPSESQFAGLMGDDAPEKWLEPSFFGALQECEADPTVNVLVLDEVGNMLGAGNRAPGQLPDPAEAIGQLLASRAQDNPLFVIWLRTYHYRRGTKNEIPSDTARQSGASMVITLHQQKSLVTAICQRGGQGEQGQMLAYRIGKDGSLLQ